MIADLIKQQHEHEKLEKKFTEKILSFAWHSIENKQT